MSDQQEIDKLAKYSEQDLKDHILSLSDLIVSVSYNDPSILKDGVDLKQLRASLRVCHDELMRRRG